VKNQIAEFITQLPPEYEAFSKIMYKVNAEKDALVDRLIEVLKDNDKLKKALFEISNCSQDHGGFAEMVLKKLVAEEYVCVMCGSNAVTTDIRPHKFLYGCASLSCDVPVQVCHECNFVSMGYEAEDLITAVINDYVSVHNSLS